MSQKLLDALASIPSQFYVRLGCETVAGRPCIYACLDEMLPGYQGREHMHAYTSIPIDALDGERLIGLVVDVINGKPCTCPMHAKEFQNDQVGEYSERPKR